jgi:hypothetical protein
VQRVVNLTVIHQQHIQPVEYVGEQHVVYLLGLVNIAVVNFLAEFDIEHQQPFQYVLIVNQPILHVQHILPVVAGLVQFIHVVHKQPVLYLVQVVGRLLDMLYLVPVLDILLVHVQPVEHQPKLHVLAVVNL